MQEIVIGHMFTWLGILFCITQSAIFSGLNLALLGISRMRLEVETSAGNPNAEKILDMRKDSNFLLTTILWGNVGINVLLTLLADSVLTGITAFFFSTFLITFLGEIAPQAYFSRHALAMGGLLAPVLKIYQFVLYPVAKPSAIMLDFWLGKEGIQYYAEKDLRTVIKKHIASSESEIDRLEGIGALNFLALDDLVVSLVGERLDPLSIISLPVKDGRPEFPDFKHDVNDGFLRQIHASGKKWIILTDQYGEPIWVMNGNAFLRDALLGEAKFEPAVYCHRPIIVQSKNMLLGKVLTQLKVYPVDNADDVIDNDLILLWTEEDKRIITGADLLGRLMRGIAMRDLSSSRPAVI